MLIEPHGGKLLKSLYSGGSEDLGGLPSIAVKDTDLMDCEQMALGTFSPVSGFMTKDELFSVLQEMKLPGGCVWTMPVILQVDNEKVRGLRPGTQVVLKDSKGKKHSLLKVSEIYQCDMEEVAKLWFKTTSREHPGVKRFMEAGRVFIAGDVQLVKRRESAWRKYELDPHQTRLIFTHKGWRKVVGFCEICLLEIC